MANKYELDRKYAQTVPRHGFYKKIDPWDEEKCSNCGMDKIKGKQCLWCKSK